MVGRDILSCAQQKKGSIAQVCRQSLLNKSKIMRMFKVLCQEGT